MESLSPGVIREDEIVIGTLDNDEILTTDAVEEIFGRAGDDTINAAGGDDFIAGGAGTDSISGGEGNDDILAGSGDDTIIGNRGDDTVHGNAGDDLIVWNNGDGSDDFSGDQGDDRVQVRFDTDLVNTDLENDDVARIAPGEFARIDFARTAVNGQSEVGLFALDIAETETLEVRFGAGEDRARLEDGIFERIEVQLDGGRDEADTAPAANGRGDTLDLGRLTTGVRVDLDENNQGVLQEANELSDSTRPGLSEFGNLQIDGEVVIAELNDFENVIGTGFDDAIFGNAQNNVLRGGAGDDVIHPFGGNDLVDGGEGTDRLLLQGFGAGQFVDFNGEVAGDLNAAGTGIAGGATINRFISIENANGSSVGGDVILANALDNDLDGLGGDDVIEGRKGNDSLDGGEGNDVLRGQNGDDLIDGGVGADTMFGGSGTDTVNGGDDADVLGGNAGDDSLVGNKGDDTVRGGNGDDLIVWNNGDGSDLFNGNEGTDTVEVNFNTDLVETDLQNDDTARIVINDARIDFARTEVNGQSEVGLFQLDIRQVETLEVNFGGGDDTADLRLEVVAVGPDAESIASPTVVLDGGAGRDTLDLSTIVTALPSGAAVDLAAGTVAVPIGESLAYEAVALGFEDVIGTEGEDTLSGGADDNALRGGIGADRLTGEAGADSFVFADGEGGDTITDFAIAEDRFGLDAASFGVAGEVAFQNVARDGEGTDAALVGVLEGQNVYVLQGTFEGNAGGAADALAEALAGGVDEGGGFFVYFNTNLNVNRLFFAEDLDNVDGGIQQLANLGDATDVADALDDLADFSAENFSFDTSDLVL